MSRGSYSSPHVRSCVTERNDFEVGDLLVTLHPLGQSRNVLYTLFSSRLISVDDRVVPSGTPVLYCGMDRSSHVLFHERQFFVYTDFEHLPITNVLGVVNRMKDAGQ